MVNIKKAPSLKEQVYDYLREAILNTDLEIGKLYSDQWVANNIGVSRTPVREAVLQLQHEGLIDVVPYRGFIIKMISKKEIIDIFQLREAIEGFSIRQLIISKKSSPGNFADLLHELKKAIKYQEIANQKEDSKDFWNADRLFHESIVKHCGNKCFNDIYRSHRDKIQLIALETLKDKNRLYSALSEHRVIVEAIEKGTELEAYEKIALHLHSTKSLIMKALEKYNPGTEASNN
ncbi:MAG: GntR family transcriptional regulator [Clostridia bacterium]|jgi:DNA-binding GntR family transcriptional regulator|nr:GntR family transcriptional regulator [Clostridia bacterium]